MANPITSVPSVKGYVTISGLLLGQVEKWFDEGLKTLAGGGIQIIRKTKNGFSNLALPSYIVAVAAVEAFVNEAFLSPVARLNFEGSSLYNCPPARLERADVREKLILVAQLLLRASIDRGAQPFQDFKMVVQARNEIVHYKMNDSRLGFVSNLKQRKIGLDVNPPEHFEDPLICAQPWIWEISSTEGIRWAHNTALKMMRHIIELMPADIEEFRRRGLESEVRYGRFSLFRTGQQHRLSITNLIDDRKRDMAWESLGIGLEKGQK